MDDTQELSGRELDRRVADIKAREREPGERVRTGLASLAWSTDDALAAQLRRELGQWSVSGMNGHVVVSSTVRNVSAEGDTEAEATARAYVYWKEQ